MKWDIGMKAVCIRESRESWWQSLVNRWHGLRGAQEFPRPRRGEVYEVCGVEVDAEGIWLVFVETTPDFMFFSKDFRPVVLPPVALAREKEEII